MYVPTDKHEPLIKLGDRRPRADEAKKPKPYLTAVNAKQGIYAGEDGKWQTQRPTIGPRFAPPPIQEVIAEKRQQVEQAMGMQVQMYGCGQRVILDGTGAKIDLDSGLTEKSGMSLLYEAEQARRREVNEQRKRSVLCSLATIQAEIARGSGKSRLHIGLEAMIHAEQLSIRPQVVIDPAAGVGGFIKAWFGEAGKFHQDEWSQIDKPLNGA